MTNHEKLLIRLLRDAGISVVLAMDIAEEANAAHETAGAVSLDISNIDDAVEGLVNYGTARVEAEQINSVADACRNTHATAGEIAHAFFNDSSASKEYKELFQSYDEEPDYMKGTELLIKGLEKYDD